MSPEQHAVEQVTVRSDIYSLGIIAYEMLTGSVPFHYPSEPRLLLAKALQDMAENAGKIGQLYITPDLLETIMNRKDMSGE